MSCFFPSRQQSLFENSFQDEVCSEKSANSTKTSSKVIFCRALINCENWTNQPSRRKSLNIWLSWVDTLRTPTPLNVAFFARTQGQSTERSRLAWRGQIATSAEQSWKKGCTGGLCRLNFGRVSLEVSLELTDLENLRWQSGASR